MNKPDFMNELRTRLAGLPQEEVEERLAFYSEMIDDGIEEGLDEAAAIAQIGSVDKIASQILSDIPFSKIAKDKIKRQRRLRAWEIVLLALGAPIWLSLGIAAFAVALSLYAVLWSLVVSAWAVFAALAGCALGGTVAGIVVSLGMSLPVGIALIGASLVSAGLSVFAFLGCAAATRGTVLLTRKMALGIKKCFVGRRAA